MCSHLLLVFITLFGIFCTQRSILTTKEGIPVSRTDTDIFGLDNSSIMFNRLARIQLCDTQLV